MTQLDLSNPDQIPLYQLPEQIAAVRAQLQALGEASPEEIARRFLRARQGSVVPLLESLTLLGHARIVEGGRFAA